MKVGLFFGTFDPIHNGHVTIAETAISTNLIDQVWFVVTPQSPFKKNSIISSKNHRLKMVDIAIQRYSNFFSSNVEFELENPQYTFKTLSFLESKFKDKHEFSLVMGLDNYISLVNGDWYKSDYILNNFRIIVYPRDQQIIKPNTCLTVLQSDLIATDILTYLKEILTWNKFFQDN